jgi:plastocyanin
MKTIVTVLVATLALAGCGSDSTAPDVAAVTLTASKQTIAVGEPLQLTATALDAGGTPISGARFAYTSSAPTILNVNVNGRVIGVAAGTASVTASSGGALATLTFTVTATSGVAVVTMSLSSFFPATTTIRAGQSVLFDFPPGEPHNVFFAQRAGRPADIPDTAGQTVSRTFNSVGQFPYDCRRHPGMSGQVVVNP